MERPKGFLFTGKRMKWEDIIFEPHQLHKDGVQAVVTFPNGQWCSIIGAPYNEGMSGLYGNGETSFEILSSSTDRHRYGVKGWLSKHQVMRHLYYIRNKKEII